MDVRASRRENQQQREKENKQTQPHPADSATETTEK
jgi:hypothetical protein